MGLKVTKKLVLHAIVGGNNPLYYQVPELEKERLGYIMPQVGGNVWIWNAEMLEKLSLQKLSSLYNRINVGH